MEYGICWWIHSLCDKYVDFDSEEETVDNNHDFTNEYKIWKIHDKALMTLITTMSTTALSCVIGCQSSKEMWNNLRERFANMIQHCSNENWLVEYKEGIRIYWCVSSKNQRL